MKIDGFMRLEPCWPEAKVRAIAGDKEDWSALDILKLDITASNKLWAVLRPEFIDDRTLRLFAVWCARQCNQTDPVCIAAIDTAERYANGEATDAELAAAWSTAWSTARSTAWSAAWSAAWYSAGTAAREAAWSAAREAAWSAAREAAWSAAESAQAAHLIEMLEGGI